MKYLTSETIKGLIKTIKQSEGQMGVMKKMQTLSNYKKFSLAKKNNIFKLYAEAKTRYINAERKLKTWSKAFEKKAAFGIPDMTAKAEIPKYSGEWEIGIHEHFAEKAGHHYDLRLGDSKAKKAYSWAIRHWPAPGEKRLAIRQSDHCLLPGTIVDDYKIEDFVKKQISKVSSLNSTKEIKNIEVNAWNKSKKEKRKIIKIQYKGKQNALTNLFCTEGHKIYTTNGIKLAANLTLKDNILYVINDYTKDQKQIIYGSLLGDGSLSKDNRYKEAHCLKQKKYIEFKAKVLNNHVSCLTTYPRSKGSFSSDLFYFYLTLKTNPFIKNLRHNLYKNNKKTINKKFLNKLKPLGLAIWYMDDGNLMWRKNNGLFRVSGCQLSTQGFTKKENIIIQKWLKEVYNIITFLVYNKRYKNPYIRLNQTNTFKFFKIIKDYILLEFDYKINPPKGISNKKCKICNESLHPKYNICDECILKNFEELGWPSQSRYNKQKEKNITFWAIYNRFKQWPNKNLKLFNNKAKNLEIPYFKVGEKIDNLDNNNFKTVVERPIIKIEKLNKNIEVYNLNVESTHNFVANGIVVGNSIPYMSWSGNIPKGYGAGKVNLLYRGIASINKAKKNKINFMVNKSKFTLIHTKDNKWLIINKK